MGAFPSATTLTKALLDEGTDNPQAALAELTALVDAVNAIIASYAQASGLCDLDSGGKIPVARLPSGGSSGTDADLLDGEHGSYYLNSSNQNDGTLPGARFTDASHGNRSGGSLHADATASTDGFMPAALFDLVNEMTPTAGTDNLIQAAIVDQHSQGGAAIDLFEKIYAGLPGMITISADIWTSANQGYYAYLSFYKNGVEQTVFQNNITTPSSQTYNMSVQPGDVIKCTLGSQIGSVGALTDRVEFYSSAANAISMLHDFYRGPQA